MIANFIKKLFASDNYKLAAHNVYVRLVEQARQPFFYEECGVADTIDGRFDVIVLHIFLLSQRLKNESPDFIRAVWEVFFADMDRSLREMGASDTGIGKRIKKMVQAFYGRIDSYEKTIDNLAEFTDSLRRNIYRNTEVSEKQIEELTSYITKNVNNLKIQRLENLTCGNVSFC